MEKLNLIAPINTLGYGVVGTNLLKYLSKCIPDNVIDKTGNTLQIDIALFPIGNVDIPRSEDIPIIRTAIDTANQFKGFANAPSLKVWHEFALADRIGNGPSFAFPFFEINKFDQKRINHLNSVGSVIVASKWAKDIVQQYIDPSHSVYVVPLGVDLEIFKPTVNPTTTDKCVFFNCGKWEKRKGHDILLEMFKNAFPDETDVELWMMCSNPFLSHKMSQEWERYYQTDPRVRLLDRVKTQSEVAAIMDKTYCGIFPSRAEGWNLELLEMMSLGKHVIATYYSAHTEFCTDSNSILLHIDNMEPAQDDTFFKESLGEWASLENNTFHEGVLALRAVYEQWKKDPNVINKEGLKTAQKLSWTNTANKLKEAIYGN